MPETLAPDLSLSIALDVNQKAIFIAMTTFALYVFVCVCVGEREVNGKVFVGQFAGSWYNYTKIRNDGILIRMQ